LILFVSCIIPVLSLAAVIVVIWNSIMKIFSVLFLIPFIWFYFTDNILMFEKYLSGDINRYSYTGYCSELISLMGISNESDVYNYLNINLLNISENINKILIDYEKFYIESIQVEAIPVGIIISYDVFKSDIDVENYIPTIFEKYDHVNPYDMIISYDNKQWISESDFLKTGIDLFQREKKEMIKIRILNSSLENIIETDCRIIEEYTSKDNKNTIDRTYTYGMTIYNGFLVTKILNETHNRRFITVGSFIAPLYTEQDSNSCSNFKIIQNTQFYNMLAYIEDSYNYDDELYFIHFSPAFLFVNSQCVYFAAESDSFIINFLSDNNIKCSDNLDAINTILDYDKPNYTQMLCQIFKWEYLSSKLPDTILHITRGTRK